MSVTSFIPEGNGAFIPEDSLATPANRAPSALDQIADGFAGISEAASSWIGGLMPQQDEPAMTAAQRPKTNFFKNLHQGNLEQANASYPGELARPRSQSPPPRKGNNSNVSSSFKGKPARYGQSMGKLSFFGSSENLGTASGSGQGFSASAKLPIDLSTSRIQSSPEPKGKLSQPPKKAQSSSPESSFKKPSPGASGKGSFKGKESGDRGSEDPSFTPGEKGFMKIVDSFSGFAEGMGQKADPSVGKGVSKKETSPTSAARAVSPTMRATSPSARNTQSSPSERRATSPKPRTGTRAGPQTNQNTQDRPRSTSPLARSRQPQHKLVVTGPPDKRSYVMEEQHPSAGRAPSNSGARSVSPLARAAPRTACSAANFQGLSHKDAFEQALEEKKLNGADVALAQRMVALQRQSKYDATSNKTLLMAANEHGNVYSVKTKHKNAAVKTVMAKGGEQVHPPSCACFTCKEFVDNHVKMVEMRLQQERDLAKKPLGF